MCIGKDVHKDIGIVKSRLMEIENDRLKHYCSKLDSYSFTQEESISIFQVSAQIQRQEKSNNLKLNDGNVITGDPARLKDIIFDYFSIQFKSADSTTASNESDNFLNHVTNFLSVEQQTELKRPITINEIYETLKMCTKKKSPGPDGLNYEFYLKNFEVVKQDLLEMFNKYLSGNDCPPKEFSSGIVTLIHKQGSKNELDQYRPISLLNCDYKLFSKILAIRIQAVLGSLLGPEQTACKPKHSCVDNLKDIRRILLRAKESIKFKGALVSLDLQKAFDNVDHAYLWKVLEHFRFPDSLIQCVKNLYTVATSRVLFNGFLTNEFKIDSSVRQGCPLSMILFVLYIEPLIRKINASISGVLIFDKFIKTIAYADDINVFIKNDLEFDLLMQILHSFEICAKIKLNYNKSVFLRLNKCTLGPQLIHEVDVVKILGIEITCTISTVVNLNYDRIIRNAKHVLKMHSLRNLNLIERSWLINAFILSKFWYLAQIIPPNQKHLAEIRSAVGQFLWTGYIFKTNRDQLYLDYDKGGIRLVDPECKMKALFIKGILNNDDGSFSEEYLLHYSRNQSLPFNFKNWIGVANDIKDETSLNTTASFYRFFISQKNIIPKSLIDHPQIEWNIIWKNFNYNFIASEDRSRIFAFCNNLIANKEKLVAYNIGRLNDSNCDSCSQPDNNNHRIEECPPAKIISDWIKNVVQSRCRIALNKLEDMLSFDIDTKSNREKAALWLAIRGISFCLKWYPNPCLYVMKKEIREMRWKHKTFFIRHFGNYVNIC